MVDFLSHSLACLKFLSLLASMKGKVQAILQFLQNILNY